MNAPLPDDDLFASLLGAIPEAERSTVLRMAEIKKKYLRSPRDKPVREGIDHLLKQAIESKDSKEIEGRIFAVLGESGAGKSASIRQALDQVAKELGGGAAKRIVRVKAPSPCTMRLLGKKVLEELGYRPERNLKENEYWDLVRVQIKRQRPLLVWIDELQHCTNALRSEDELQKLCDTLKLLIQQPHWPPVSLILSGLPSLADFVERDDQILRRTGILLVEPIAFPADAPTLRRLIVEIVRNHAGMEISPSIDTDEFLHRLCQASGNAFGLAVCLTRDAVAKALDQGDQSVEARHFAAAYASVARNGAPNIFTAEDWTAVRTWYRKPKEE